MTLKKIEAKDVEKMERCLGCDKLFPKAVMKKCNGCIVIMCFIVARHVVKKIGLDTEIIEKHQQKPAAKT